MKKAKEKSVLAIDLGLANIGWAFYFNRIKKLDSGTLYTNPTQTLSERLNYIGRFLPVTDVLVIEDCFGPPSRAMNRVMGAIILSTKPKELLTVFPSTWKSQWCGKRGTSAWYARQIMGKALQRPGGFTGDQHEADALALYDWYCGGRL